MTSLSSRIRKLGLDEIYGGDDRLADQEEETRRFDRERRTQDLEGLAKTLQELTGDDAASDAASEAAEAADAVRPDIETGEGITIALSAPSAIPDVIPDEADAPVSEEKARRVPGWLVTVLIFVVLAGAAFGIWYMIR